MSAPPLMLGDWVADDGCVSRRMETVADLDAWQAPDRRVRILCVKRGDPAVTIWRHQRLPPLDPVLQRQIRETAAEAQRPEAGA